MEILQGLVLTLDSSHNLSATVLQSSSLTSTQTPLVRAGNVKRAVQAFTLLSVEAGTNFRRKIPTKLFYQTFMNLQVTELF